MKLRNVVHLNYADNNGKVYCRQYHKIVTIGTREVNCTQCPYFFGSLQGQGVECRWEDDNKYGIDSYTSPTKELLRVSQLIDKGILKKDI